MNNMSKEFLLNLFILLSVVWVTRNTNINIPKNSNTTFNLFTLNNRENPIVIRYEANDTTIINSGINPSLKTKFIVHGWTSGYYKTNLFNRLWMKDMTDYILQQMDCNVICVDWSKLAADLDYLKVLPNVPITGQMIALFIQRLIDLNKISLNDIHCIGHSLGAHVCGYVGKAFEEKKLSQITGLDPARPGFEEDDPKTRLNPKDAELVVVLHTSSGIDISGDLNIDGFIGNPSSLGHLDFRINGGNIQPMCNESIDFKKAFKDIISLRIIKGESALEKVGFCPHETAYIYPIINPGNGCQFIAYQCSNEENFKSGKCAEVGKPIPLFFDFYENANNLSETKPPNNLFVGTGKAFPFCLFHYQILMKLSKSPDSVDQAQVWLDGTNPVTLEINLLSINQTYLYMCVNELGQINGANVTTEFSEVISIEINYLSHFNERFA